MSIFFCSSCKHTQETTNEHIGKPAKCPKCKESYPIYDTVSFVKKLTEKYMLKNEQVRTLQKELSKIKEVNQEEIIEVYDSLPVEDFNIYNTNLFSQKEHYEPVLKFFQQKGIQAHVDSSAMDTTGFFDEVAIRIGENYDLFSPILSQIKYIQSKKYSTVKLSLSKYSNNEIEQIVAFCKMLYNYAFIVRYKLQKKEKVLYITLQEIPSIKNFFNGIWMEWFVFIKLLALFSDKNITPSIVRSLHITFSNKDKNELDIFFIAPNGENICIECKTGEFREDLNKYFTLQKKLNIKKENFILCVFGLDDEQAQGLTSMYEITLVNESTLIDKIKSLF